MNQKTAFQIITDIHGAWFCTLMFCVLLSHISISNYVTFPSFYVVGVIVTKNAPAAPFLLPISLTFLFSIFPFPFFFLMFGKKKKKKPKAKLSVQENVNK